MEVQLEIAIQLLAAMISTTPDGFDFSPGRAREMTAMALNLSEALLEEHKERNPSDEPDWVKEAD